MGEIGDRIKEIRKSAGLTQQKFADRIGAKQNTVAQYEIGRNTPIDPVITAICKEFDVQEDWLRYGMEPMRAEKSAEEEISDYVAQALNGSSEFQKAVIKMICTRSEGDLKALERAFRDICVSLEKEKARD